MSGIELRTDTLVVDRAPNRLDELVIAFSNVLTRFDINHVYTGAYIAILTGRPKATASINVHIEEIDNPTATRLAATLSREGFWGAGMPLTALHENLATGDTIRIAPEDQLIPYLAVQFAHDDTTHAPLENTLTAHINDDPIPITAIELQLALNLAHGTQSTFEDAVHLYTLFEDSLDADRLENWVTTLDVETEYDQLKHA